MNIINNSLFNSVSFSNFSFSNILGRPLTAQEKRVALVGLAALNILIAGCLIYRLCFKATRKDYPVVVKIKRPQYDFDGQDLFGKGLLEGVKTYTNGIVEKGTFNLKKDCSLYDQNGERTLPNGDKEVGAFFCGRLHGKGTIIYSNGDKLEGKFDKGHYVEV